MSQETQPASWLKVTFDFLITSLFLALIGGLFVVFCVLLGKKELLILAYVLLSAVFLRSLLSEQWQYLLERIVIIGEGLRIFRILEEHYTQYEPRTMWYYLFFPITSVWGFVVDRERGRKELKSYWRLLQWVLFMLIIGGFTSYYRLYRYFSWQTSLAWLYTELLAIYFLCNFFAVPLSTTSIRLSIQQKKRRLFFLTCLSLAILTGSLYVFSIRSNLTRLIPMNLVLDLRLAQLKELKTSPHKQENELLLAHDSSRYFDEIQQKTKMFFQFYGPRVIAFHQKHFFDRDEQLKTRFYKGLNRTYQEFLASTSMLHENKHIYLTLTQTPSAFWGAVCFPFRESIFYLFRYESKKPFGKRFTLYKKLKDLPSTLRREISGMWDTDVY
ncbi:MAG TPA: hypothetical protein DCE42_10280, partial [Myxococcales bacterium]|nr:hypothetical protein [Myxococcales bacterium]